MRRVTVRVRVPTPQEAPRWDRPGGEPAFLAPDTTLTCVDAHRWKSGATLSAGVGPDQFTGLVSNGDDRTGV